MDAPPTRRTVRRRRRHRPPAVVGDPIEYPPEPYTWDARVRSTAFLGRSLRQRGFPRQHRWVLYLLAGCVALPFVAAALSWLL